MKGPASGFRQPTFPSIVSASRSLHWCRQCIVADGSGTLSLVRVFSLVEPQRQRQNLLEGDGEDATHSGITTRESGTTAARSRRDAAGDRGLQRADNEVPDRAGHDGTAGVISAPALRSSQGGHPLSGRESSVSATS